MKIRIIIPLIALLATVLVPLLAVPVHAASNNQALCVGAGGTWKEDEDLPNGGSCNSSDGRTVLGTIQQVTDVLVFLVGAIAVLMIIIGGLRYTTSSGDQSALTSAKNTIIYALVGLIVAFMAYAIVHFVFGIFNIK